MNGIINMQTYMLKKKDTKMSPTRHKVSISKWAIDRKGYVDVELRLRYPINDEDIVSIVMSGKIHERYFDWLLKAVKKSGYRRNRPVLDVSSPTRGTLKWWNRLNDNYKKFMKIGKF